MKWVKATTAKRPAPVTKPAPRVEVLAYHRTTIGFTAQVDR